MDWQPLDTGCGVKCNILFLDNDVTLSNKTIMDDNTFFYTNNFNNGSSVIMWATFNNIRGMTRRQIVLKPQQQLQLLRPQPQPSKPPKVITFLKIV